MIKTIFHNPCKIVQNMATAKDCNVVHFCFASSPWQQDLSRKRRLYPIFLRSSPPVSDFYARQIFLEKLYRIFMEGFVSDFYFRVRIRLLCEGAYQIGSLDLSKGLRSVHSRFICRGFQIDWVDDTDDDRDDVVLVGDDDLSHHKID